MVSKYKKNRGVPRVHLFFFDFVQDVLNKVKMQNIQAVFISIF